jgi:hypothetical protein
MSGTQVEVEEAGGQGKGCRLQQGPSQDLRVHAFEVGNRGKIAGVNVRAHR